MEPNVHHLPAARTATRKPAAAAPPRSRFAPGPPSPLKKQSDYQLVAPLASKPVASRHAPAPPPAAAAAAGKLAPVTPAKPQKPRKKFLCATPPQVLQDIKGKREYDRGRQLGEGGFARCFLVQNKEGDLFAAKTVAKKSLQSQKMKGKVCFCLPGALRDAARADGRRSSFSASCRCTRP